MKEIIKMNSIYWHYTENNDYPKKEGTYLCACIEQPDEIKRGRSETFTTYASYGNGLFYNDEYGYDYNVYAWASTVQPPEQLNEKDWKYFCVNYESTWKKLHEYCKANNFKFEFNTSKEEYLYADIEILCTREQEKIINELIDHWE